MISSHLQREEHAVGEHRHHDLDARVVDARLAHLDPRLAHEVDGVHDDGGEYHGGAWLGLGLVSVLEYHGRLRPMLLDSRVVTTLTALTTLTGDPLLLDVLAARGVGPLEARHVGVDLVAQLGLGLGVGVELGFGPCWRGAGNTVGVG